MKAVPPRVCPISPVSAAAAARRVVLQRKGPLRRAPAGRRDPARAAGRRHRIPCTGAAVWTCTGDTGQHPVGCPFGSRLVAQRKAGDGAGYVSFRGAREEAIRQLTAEFEHNAWRSETLTCGGCTAREFVDRISNSGADVLFVLDPDRVLFGENNELVSLLDQLSADNRGTSGRPDLVDAAQRRHPLRAGSFPTSAVSSCSAKS